MEFLGTMSSIMPESKHYYIFSRIDFSVCYYLTLPHTDCSSAPFVHFDCVPRPSPFQWRPLGGEDLALPEAKISSDGACEGQERVNSASTRMDWGLIVLYRRFQVYQSLSYTGLQILHIHINRGNHGTRITVITQGRRLLLRDRSSYIANKI